MPQRAYTTLSPATSPFHPSRLRNKRLSLSPPQVPIAPDGESGDESVPWYEQVDLTTLVIANNEIDHLEEELGAFEDLQTLDVSAPDRPVSRLTDPTFTFTESPVLCRSTTIDSHLYPNRSLS